MGTPFPSRRQGSLCFWTAATFFVALPPAGRAGWLTPESAGLRYGVPTSSASINFHQGEAFADWDLPWKWDLGKKWTLQTRQDLSAGWFSQGAAGGGIFGAGPLFALNHEHLPISFASGVNVTGMTRTHFETKNFGEPVQFTSHLGVYWDFAEHCRLGCRFQHMSNAGMSQHNPGINFLMFGLSYVF